MSPGIGGHDRDGRDPILATPSRQGPVRSPTHRAGPAVFVGTVGASPLASGRQIRAFRPERRPRYERREERAILARRYHPRCRPANRQSSADPSTAPRTHRPPQALPYRRRLLPPPPRLLQLPQLPRQGALARLGPPRRPPLRRRPSRPERSLRLGPCVAPAWRPSQPDAARASTRHRAEETPSRRSFASRMRFRDTALPGSVGWPHRKARGPP
jgi:hypothetical protein